MRVKAYIPGTDNVLIGDWEPVKVNAKGRGFIGRLQVTTRNGEGLTQTLDLYDGWEIEPILELPTKRDALVRYTDGGGFSNTAWRSEADSSLPWQDGGGAFDDAILLDEIKLHSDGKFEIIFEGTDD
jgi:hypothetical protein